MLGKVKANIPTNCISIIFNMGFIIKVMLALWMIPLPQTAVMAVTLYSAGGEIKEQALGCVCMFYVLMSTGHER